MALRFILEIVLGALYLSLITTTIVIILRENRKPVRALSWILVLLLLPVAGLICYYIIGQYFRKRKIISKKKIRKVTKIPHASYQLSTDETEFLHEHQRMLIKLLEQNNNATAFPCNRIDVLTNGKETFEAMFEAIEQAKEHIHIEFYIFGDDKISNQLRELLIKKAQQGVRVRMIYDFLGSFSLSKKYIESLNTAGVYVVPFLPARLKAARIKINYRNHRKILVVDGKIGFTGGLNIADRYMEGNKLGMWRDTFVRMEGLAVHGLQTNFLIDWYFAGEKLIRDSKYYPALHAVKNSLVQIVSSAPDSDWENIMQGISYAIITAQKYVYIHTPYFIPPETILSAIQVAALSGIDVRLMIPQKSDAPVSTAASHSYVESVLEAGVKVFWYTDGFLHSKAIVIDDMISIVGSANIDERSTSLNFELNAFIFNNETAIELKKSFVEDMKQCNEISIEKWEKRSSWNKLKESLARLLSPMM